MTVIAYLNSDWVNIPNIYLYQNMSVYQLAIHPNTRGGYLKV